MPFLIFRKTNNQDFSLDSARLVTLIDGKEQEDGTKAIGEGAIEGEGTYVAIWFDREDIIVKDVQTIMQVTDPLEQPKAEMPSAELERE